jgi:hypothetical protein
MATFTADKNAAYHGRLGQQDGHYKDPGFTGTVGGHEADVEAEPDAAPESPAVEEPEEEAEEDTGEEAGEEADEDVPVDSLTVEQLKDELDGWGVEYGSNDRKADLQEKLRAARGA